MAVLHPAYVEGKLNARASGSAKMRGWRAVFGKAPKGASAGVVAAIQDAKHYAEVRQELRVSGRPIPENDVWIAALARQHKLPVVSQDAHFDAVRGIRRRTW
jgi:tRNA(fMet)-specific endonuclease VapC